VEFLKVYLSETLKMETPLYMDWMPRRWLETQIDPNEEMREEFSH
jgi:hypothetical protein